MERPGARPSRAAHSARSDGFDLEDRLPLPGRPRRPRRSGPWQRSGPRSPAPPWRPADPWRRPAPGWPGSARGLPLPGRAPARTDLRSGRRSRGPGRSRGPSGRHRPRTRARSACRREYAVAVAAVTNEFGRASRGPGRMPRRQVVDASVAPLCARSGPCAPGRPPVHRVGPLCAGSAPCAPGDRCDRRGRTAGPCGAPGEQHGPAAVIWRTL